MSEVDLILSKLEQTQSQYQELHNQIIEIRVTDLPDIKNDISSLKTKVTIWGTVTALIVSGIVTTFFRIL